MRSQEQAFRAYYASMTDGELLQIANHRNSFIPIAQKVLADELAKRGLALPAPLPLVRHSLLWNWGNHLARLTRRLHHHPAAS